MFELINDLTDSVTALKLRSERFEEKLNDVISSRTIRNVDELYAMVKKNKIDLERVCDALEETRRFKQLFDKYRGVDVTKPISTINDFEQDLENLKKLIKFIESSKEK